MEGANKSQDYGVAAIKNEYLKCIRDVGINENSSIDSQIELVKRKIDTESLSVDKKKRRGRNYNRPKLVQLPKNEKLCRNLWDIAEQENAAVKCEFQNCQFSHDVAKYCSEKPDDIGDKCHNFATYGYCPYGLTCRFGKSHTENGFNVTNNELWSSWGQELPVKNKLAKNVQFQLRKKTYNFEKAEAAYDFAQKLGDIDDSSAKIPQDSASLPCDHAKSSENRNGSVFEKIDVTDDNTLYDLKKKHISWEDQLYLAPLTTVGNLPFRRICKEFGADITCSEMAMSTCLLQGSPSEWALVRRHKSENIFGIQLCGSNIKAMVRCAQLLEDQIDMDFIDINMGCPIDLVYKQGAGCALLRRVNTVKHMVHSITQCVSCPVTLKMRTSIYNNTKMAHSLLEQAKSWGASMFTVHGRSKEQRFTKLADWDYLDECAKCATPVPMFGNGDVLTYEEYNRCRHKSKVSGIMIGRGALIKPWIFREIKEQRDWDISSSERFDILRNFTNYCLEHWGSDSEGVEKSRRFLLEWLSFLHRYIPIGLLDQPQMINQRPPKYRGRNELETLMASANVADWIRVSEMLLGKVSDNFSFLPKHKANSWSD